MLTAVTIFSLFTCVIREATGFNPQSWIYRNGRQLEVDGLPFTTRGRNVDFLGLAGADEDESHAGFVHYPTLKNISDTLDVLAKESINVVRSKTLGVSVGSPLSVMPQLGRINEDAFQSMDWAIYQAGQKGIRLTVPLTDSLDMYYGGKHTFLRWRGYKSSATSKDQLDAFKFYTDATIIEDFKNYIKTILTHKNQYNSLTYAEDPTIFAYEIGSNVQMNDPNGHNRVPDAWVNDIAGHIKQIAPKKLVVNGSPGPYHLYIPNVDLFYYPEQQNSGSEKKSCLTTEYSWSSLLGHEDIPYESSEQITMSEQSKTKSWRCYFT